MHHLTESVNLAVSTLGHGQAIGVDGHHSDAVFPLVVGLEVPVEGYLPLLQLLLVRVFGNGSCNSSLPQKFWDVLHLLLIFSEGDLFVRLGSRLHHLLNFVVHQLRLLLEPLLCGSSC